MRVLCPGNDLMTADGGFGDHRGDRSGVDRAFEIREYPTAAGKIASQAVDPDDRGRERKIVGSTLSIAENERRDRGFTPSVAARFGRKIVDVRQLQITFEHSFWLETRRDRCIFRDVARQIGALDREILSDSQSLVVIRQRRARFEVVPDRDRERAAADIDQISAA